MLLVVALLFSILVPRLDGRFLEIRKQPPGPVAIVPNDEDGESVLLGAVFHDSQELDREKASGMISVKLLNQFHARSFDIDDQLVASGVDLGDGQLRSTGPDYESINHLDTDGGNLDPPFVPAPPVESDAIDMKENVIEGDFLPTEPLLPKRHWADQKMLASKEDDSRESTTVAVLLSARENKSKSLTQTTTTTSTTTVRKVQRKTLQQSLMSTTSSRPLVVSTTQVLPPVRVSIARADTTTTTSNRPPVPRIDITKLNLEHLENELVSFPTLVPPQALAYSPRSGSSRLLPRSIRPDEGPGCGCQHKKRSLLKSHYSSEEMDPTGDYDDYDYDMNDVRKAHRPLLFPAMSRFLATASSEPLDSSIERAEKVHGTLERLMGIVTIFSHVDEFIQRRTKQSIRRLARLYESEELD